MLVLLFPCPISLAKGKVAKTKEKDDIGDEDKVKKEKSEKSNNGKVYGKDKGDLKGKEFGKERSEAARSQKDEKVKH